MSSDAGFATLILGGIPVSKDLAPSIIFCVLYGILGALWVYRMVKKETRSLLILKPGIFVQIRIVTLAIRAYMSQGNYATGLFIVELIFLTVGVIAILDPLIQCFNSHIHPFQPSDAAESSENANRNWLEHVANILRLLVLAVLVTGIVTGSLSSGAISDPNGSGAQTVHTLRTVNYILSLVILVVLIAATVYAQRRYPAHLDQNKSLFIILTSLVLVVPSAYKIATLDWADPSSWAHSSSAFFVLVITFEFIATALLLIFPTTIMFPSEKARKRIQDKEAAMGLRLDESYRK
ncbi:hypothetical protein BDY24DRAFT_440285 [Mrakia frigida]|uniref:uncharacterized protein n=1 Tax=Mrakia frigida TaxID=29902 RepID=UPI003FCC12E8